MPARDSHRGIMPYRAHRSLCGFLRRQRVRYFQPRPDRPGAPAPAQYSSR